MMQYDKNFALMEGKDVVILQPEKPAEGFQYDSKTEQLNHHAPAAKALEKKALSWALWGSLAYEQGLYRLSK
ncbi:MAG: LTA synthase family protein, partial [Shewanella sp.]